MPDRPVRLDTFRPRNKHPPSEPAVRSALLYALTVSRSERTTTHSMGRLVDETMTDFDSAFSSMPIVCMKHSRVGQTINTLPWSPTVLKPQQSFADLNDVIALGREAMMWRSAPTLSFDPDDESSSFAFEEPDFNAHQLESPHQTLSRPEPTSKIKNSAASVKVKASLLRNMSGKEKEIKGLFSQWKEEHKKCMPDFAWSNHANKTAKIDWIESINSRPKVNSKSLKKQQSPGKKVTKMIPSFAASSPNLKFNVDDDSPYDAVDKFQPPVISPNTSTGATSPKRKKKIAVKLKASDLNLSEAKTKEIEDLFWQWKGEVKDPNSPPVGTFEKPREDHRWVDEITTDATDRPKPACRTRSASLEPLGEWPGGDGAVEVKRRSTRRTRSSGKIERSDGAELEQSTGESVEQKLTSCLRRTHSGIRKVTEKELTTLEADSSAPKRVSGARRGRSREPLKDVNLSSGSKGKVPTSKKPSQHCQVEVLRPKSKAQPVGKQKSTITRPSSEATRKRSKSRGSWEPRDGDSSAPRAPTRSRSIGGKETRTPNADGATWAAAWKNLGSDVPV